MYQGKQILALCAFIVILWSAPSGMAEEILREDFESLPDGTSIGERKQWQAFVGLRGKDRPTASVREGVGVDGSNALAVWHDKAFRSDNWGLHVALPKPLDKGIVWLQCQVKLPQESTAGLFFDARNKRAIVTRVASHRFDSKTKTKPQTRWHASWGRSYWRLYTLTDLTHNRWHTLTVRLDLDHNRYAVWLDKQTLGEYLPVCAQTPVTHIYVSVSGTKEHPALIDNLIVTRTTPNDLALPPPFPKAKKELVFRFAAIGDPQLGFGGYDTDKLRFRMAVQQVNEAHADLSLILGDMVHLNDNEKAYRDVVAIAKGLENPHYYVRGNHERIDYYKKHFHPKLDYSIEHKGFRFVFLDAIGNHAGLSDTQLSWLGKEFQQAEQADQEIVLNLHVSPWENNERGQAKYNQIGKGRKQLRKLMQKHKVLLCLSGHYHRGYWHAKEEQTHYLTLGGTARVAFGYLSWSIFDIYPDRVEIFQKPVFFNYEQKGATRYHNGIQWQWYASTQERYPYQQIGPLIISRHRQKLP